MYFAPQPRALFEQHNSKSTPNMQCFEHLTSKFASRHSGVHLSQFPKVLQKGKLKIDFKRCFAPQRRAIFDLSYDQMAPQLLFDPPEPQNNGKNTVFRDCSTYLSAHLDVLSTDSLSLLTLSLLCFSDCSHHKLDF